MDGISVLRTDSEHPDFIALVALLDADLAERDGDDNAFYRQFNKIAHIKQTVLLYAHEKAVGCGAIKAFDEQAVEVKRMYTLPGYRGRHIATRILQELENWAAELGYSKTVLETGKRQPEAIALYEKNGYLIMPNYGQYIGIDNSVCFEKKLIHRDIFTS